MELSALSVTVCYYSKDRRLEVNALKLTPASNVAERELTPSLTAARGSAALRRFAGSPADFLTKPEVRFPRQYNAKTKIRK